MSQQSGDVAPRKRLTPALSMFVALPLVGLKGIPLVLRVKLQNILAGWHGLARAFSRTDMGNCHKCARLAVSENSQDLRPLNHPGVN